MRFLSFVLAFWATTALAGTFGPERALTEVTGQELPAISIPTNGIVAIWNGGSGMFGGRGVWSQPIPASSTLTLAQSPRRDGAVVSIGDQSMVAWVNDDWVYSQIIGSDGRPIGQARILQMVDSRHTTRMAVGASRSSYLVAWQQESSILATALDAQGNVISSQVWLVPGTYGRNVEKIAVASDGSAFLVVWESSTDEPWTTPCGVGCKSTDRQVRSIVVGADGIVRPETEMLLASNAGIPDVVWTGTDYLVAWTSLPNGGITALHVGSNGVPAGTATTISTTSDWSPSVAVDGSGADIAYVRLRSDNGLELRALRVNADGTTTPLSPAPLGLGVGARQFQLASNGDHAALVYTGSGRINVRYLDLSSALTRSRAARH